jgi:hypothetical protein
MENNHLTSYEPVTICSERTSKSEHPSADSSGNRGMALLELAAFQEAFFA